MRTVGIQRLLLHRYWTSHLGKYSWRPGHNGAVFWALSRRLNLPSHECLLSRSQALVDRHRTAAESCSTGATDILANHQTTSGEWVMSSIWDVRKTRIHGHQHISRRRLFSARLLNVGHKFLIRQFQKRDARDGRVSSSKFLLSKADEAGLSIYSTKFLTRLSHARYSFCSLTST